MNLLLVGGVFNGEGGRSSGYFGKLAESIACQLPGIECTIVNGGYIDGLVGFVDMGCPTHIIWMCDVPNTYDKVLPSIMKKNPGVVLIQSKSNIGKRYRDEELYGRMYHSGAEMLVEFDQRCGKVYACVRTCTGAVVSGWTDRIDYIASVLVGEINRLDALVMPLEVMPGEIPMWDHVGAFGIERVHDVHTGVDLYCAEGTAVYAMEDSYYVSSPYFTGERVGTPWWEDTDALMLAGASGVLLYGEIQFVALPSMHIPIRAGQLIGHVKRVLKNDKGRPMSMLHMERYVHGTRGHVHVWPLGAERDPSLLDVTSLLRGKG